MFTQFMKEKSFAGCNPTCKETGFALLGTVFVAALVMSIGALGIMAMTKSASTNVYGENAANQARTAALMGINALTQYAEQKYTSDGMKGVSGVPVGTAIVKSMGANDKAPLSNVQAAVIANTYYIPPNSSGIVANQNGAIFVQSTGRAGPYAETARAMLTLQQNNANGAFVPTPYDIFALFSATFNRGSTTGAKTTIGAGSANINGGSTIGNLSAGSVSLTGHTTFSSISAAYGFSSNGNNQGTVQLGNQVIGGLPASGNGLTYQLLSANATSQLEQNIIEQQPLINPLRLGLYAGLEFQDYGNGNETGDITVSPSEAAILNENLQPGATPILGNIWFLQPSTTEGTQELDSLETAICGHKACLSYSGGIDGTWSIKGGFSPTLAALIYVEGGLTVNGNSGSASNPLYLTIGASGAVTFNGNAYLKPYATLPGLCTTLAYSQVCNGGSPWPGFIGLSIVSGSTSGTYYGNGITFKGNSGIYGSIASYGNITINRGSTIYGRVVTDNSLTMNGKVGTLVQGAGNANFGGGSPATANPPIVAIRWLRWM